jgi:hypothetical protein
MNISLALARLAGARTDVLAQARSDIPKYATMGGVILSTALVGAASAFFALTSAAGFPAWVGAIVAVGWGVVILNLDRMLVVSMHRDGGWPALVGGVLARVALAAVIGTVISTPMVLQIFKPEIDNQLVVMQNEQRQAQQAEIDKTFAQRAPLEAQVAHLQAVASGQEKETAAADPDVVNEQQAYDKANAAYETAEQAAICETQGTCPGASGVPGIGALQRQKQAFADQKKGERDAAQAALDTATKNAQRRIDTAGPQNQEHAKAELATAQSRLDAMNAEQSQYESSAATAAEHGGGLLARLQALGRLSAGNSTMQAAHIMVFLLFLLLELLPVIVKSLALLSRRNTYETLLERENLEVLEGDEDERRREVETRRRVRDEIEADRADRLIEAGKEATAHVLETHREVSRRAVDVWAHVALARSDDQLRQWYAAQGGTRFPLEEAAGAAPVVVDVVPDAVDDAEITTPIPLSALATVEIPIQRQPAPAPAAL